jgi:hypothetical protein
MKKESIPNRPNIDDIPMKLPDGGVAILSEEERVANGPVLILLGIALLGLIGGMWYWFTVLPQEQTNRANTTRPTTAENNEPESSSAEATAEALGVVSTSDELSAISADLESTRIDALGSELEAITAELEAAVQE